MSDDNLNINQNHEPVFYRTIKKTQAKFYIDDDTIVLSDSNQQGSYNLPKEFFQYAMDNQIIVEDPDLEYSRKEQDGNAYVLNGYKFKLGLGILWLIGNNYKDIENKFIASIPKNNKFQIFRAVYLNKVKQHDDGYQWFVDLYDKNISGNKLILKINENEKTLTFDIKFNAIQPNISYDEIQISEDFVSDNENDEISHNNIFFGAPGTGKSFTLNQEKDKLLQNNPTNFERVTFHPDYSYAHFVGTYKPVPKIDKKGEEVISYEYVPGPFMRILVNSIKNQSEPHLLIIEEINRSNVAAVFGDVFQLLDRKDNGYSEYPIQASEDIKKYLKDVFGENYPVHFPNDEIRIPNNMFIWATMNSADQGVYMMDTAFKRRWDFSYIGINNSSNPIKDINISLGKDSYKRIINWDCLRRSINNELLSYGINEDKLLGPFFINPKFLPKNEADNEKFIDIFKNKVIMYLFEDVAKSKRSNLFDGVTGNTEYLLYSEICNEFDEKGIHIFSETLRNNYEALLK